MLDYRQSDVKDLLGVLDEIEAILKFRPEGATHRPVIYIDEIANITITDANKATVAIFFNWLIEVSRDRCHSFHLCCIHLRITQLLSGSEICEDYFSWGPDTDRS